MSCHPVGPRADRWAAVSEADAKAGNAPTTSRWRSFWVGLLIAVGCLAVVLGSVALTMLELFVAFLQAFIFTFLTTLFIGMSVVFHHDEHEEAAAH